MKTFADFGIQTGGKSGAEIKVTCPQCSPHRKKKTYPCLNANTEKGVWNCHHCGWAGSLKSGEQQRAEVKKEYRKPVFAPKAEALADPITAWFLERGITDAVLKRNHVSAGKAYFPQVEEERGAILFPYFRGTEVVNIKYRSREKLFRMEAGAERILYGLNDVEPITLWVEGEMDKLSCEVAGYLNCVSVPDGAPAPDSKNYETKFSFLDAVELDAISTHIIAVDSDAPGRRLAEELIRRLGDEKCRTVTWPEGCKDANDVLVAHGAEALAKCLASSQPVPISGAYTVDDFFAKVEEFYEQGLPKGEKTGWRELDDHYSVRPGEWTLITGIPGHGKSEFLDAVAINLAANSDWPIAVYSPENQPPELHISKMLEKYSGKPFGPGPTDRMTKAELQLGKDWMRERFFWVLPEQPSLDVILSVAKRLVLRHGIRGLIVDPWNEIEHSRPENLTETDYISLALSKVRQFARAHGVHVWLVAHPTKLYKEKDGKYPVPTPYDVSGSSHWRNKADNCITVWRDTSIENNRDVEIHIQKIRHKFVGKLGMVRLLYDNVTGRYHDGSRAPAPIVRDYKSAQAGEYADERPY